MSGPKYYDIPIGSGCSAAEILSKLSVFQPGVQVEVRGGTLHYTVSNNAWMSGVNYNYLSGKVQEARDAVQEDRRYKALVSQEIAKGKARIKEVKDSVQRQYAEQKQRLDAARARCESILNGSNAEADTSFGKVRGGDISAPVRYALDRIRKDLADLDKERDSSLRQLDAIAKELESVNSLDAASRKAGKIGSLKLGDHRSDSDVDSSIADMNKSKAIFDEYIKTVKSLGTLFADPEMTPYRDRMASLVTTLDPLSKDSRSKIDQCLKEIMVEIEVKRKAQEIGARNAAISEKLDEILRGMEELRKIMESFEVHFAETGAMEVELTAYNTELLGKCLEQVEELNKLEYISSRNRGEIDRIARSLEGRQDLATPGRKQILEGAASQLKVITESCGKDMVKYLPFKQEKDRYDLLYPQFVALTAGPDSQVEDGGYFSSAANLLFQAEYADKQVKHLREINDKLEEVVGEYRTASIHSALCAAVESRDVYERFGFERTESGELHKTLVRKDSKGVMFDISAADGKVAVSPRGVMLHNGAVLMEPDELRKYHGSCTWASELDEALGGLDLGLDRTECSDEVCEETYDVSNYYRLANAEESLRYLKMCGYSESEIQRLMAGEAGAREDKDETEEDHDGDVRVRTEESRRGAASKKKQMGGSR